MEIMFRNSYFVALAKLGTAEQERIQRFISKLQHDPTTLGLNIEPIDNGFVSIRANQRIRVIAQQQGETLLLHYIGDHDPAYEWAKKRRLLASLENGSYRFEPDELDTQVPSDKSSLPAINATLYGEQMAKKLEGSNLPAYIVRSLETCQSEDELYERLETLPQHFQYATLAAIQDLPYEPRLAMENPEKQTVVSSPQNLDVYLTVAQAENRSDGIYPVIEDETAISTEPILLPTPEDCILEADVAKPDIVFVATGDSEDTNILSRSEQSAPFSSQEIVVEYEATRLLFRAKLIEPLHSSQSFRIITPGGVFEMTKSEFYSVFSNVVASASYRENGIYHYASLPRKALAYRVDDLAKL
jgi:hypothetical protein